MCIILLYVGRLTIFRSYIIIVIVNLRNTMGNGPRNNISTVSDVSDGNLQFQKFNEVYLRIKCEPSVARELSEFFTFEVPNAKFMPSVRNRLWDGKIRLFNVLVLVKSIWDYYLMSEEFLAKSKAI